MTESYPSINTTVAKQNPDVSPAGEQSREINTSFVYTVRYPEGKTSEEGERLAYNVANPNYEGDYAFLSLEDAIVYGFPQPKPVYIVRIGEGKVVEPHPETAPGTVYIANGSSVEAIRVPAEYVNQYIDSVLEKREIDSNFTHRVIESTFPDASAEESAQ